MYEKNNTTFLTDLLGMEEIHVTVTYSYNVIFTYREIIPNRFYSYEGFEINDKYKVTEIVFIDCKQEKYGVLGGKSINQNMAMEGNHIRNSTTHVHGLGIYAFKQAKHLFEAQREHWSKGNKYIVPVSRGQITDVNTQGKYHTIAVNSGATAYRDPVSYDVVNANHRIAREVGSLAGSMLREYKPFELIYRLGPVVEELTRSNSSINELPEKSEAAVNALIIVCCDADGKVQLNYKAARGTTLPYGTTFSRKIPGKHIESNSAKFTVDLDVDVK